MALQLFNQRLELLAKTRSKDEARGWATENRKLHKIRQLTDEEITALEAQGRTHIKDNFPDKLGEVMEHYGRDGLTTVQKPSPSPGAALSEEAIEPVASTIPREVGAAPGGTPQPMVPQIASDQMRAALQAWNAMADAITDPVRDLVTIQGQPYRRVTFWRKARKAYGIAMIVRSQGSDSEKMTASAEIEFTAPNGDKATGYGYASKAEEKLAKASLHEIISRAYSRAFVRGLRDLIGFGEPSAEEVEE